jgi:competence protein ComGC
MAGYCNQCRENVWLNADGSCPRGHSAEHISGAYEAGPPPPSAPQPYQPQPYEQPVQYAQQPAQYPAQPAGYPPQAAPYGAPPGQEPERKASHAGVVALVIGVTVLGLIFLCGILAAIAIPVLNSAKTDAGQKACFANQRMVYGASQSYMADKGTLPQSMDDLIDAGLIESEPVCPSQGSYLWDRATGKITCSVHGSYETGGPEPPTQ